MVESRKIRLQAGILVLLFALTIALVLSGCTKTVEKTGGALILSRSELRDINGDGIDDVATYVFAPIDYDYATVQKIVLVSPEWNMSSISVNLNETGAGATRYHIDNISAFEEMRKHVDAFDNKRSNKKSITGEAQCEQYLGLGREELPCKDVHSCEVSCQGAPICKEWLDGLGEPFAHDLLYLQTKFDEMDTYISRLNVLINDMEQNRGAIPREDADEFLSLLQKINYLGNEINNNPIINPNMYNLCNNIDYDSAELQGLSDVFMSNFIIETPGNVNIAQGTPVYSYVDYKMFLLIIFKSSGAYENMLVYDELPKNMDYREVLIDSNFTEMNGTTIIWNLKKVGTGDVDSYAAYSLKSNTLLDSDHITSSLSSPRITIETLSILEAPYVKPVVSLMAGSFNFVKPFTNYYVALAVSVFFIVLIIWVILLLLSLLWNVLLGIFSQASLGEGLKKWVGKGNPKYAQYLILGIAIFAIALAASFFMDGYMPSNLDFKAMSSDLRANPAQTVASVAMFIGLLTIMFSIEEGLRGMGGGFRVSKKQGLLQQNLKDLEELKKEIKQLNENMSFAHKYHINTSEEESIIYSIPLERMENLIIHKGDQATAKQMLDESLARVDMGIKTIGNKIDEAEKYINEATGYIEKMLKEQGSVNVDSLVTIPKDWREWAVEYYLMIHPEKDLIIERGMLKPVSVAKTKKKTFNEVSEALLQKGVDRIIHYSIDGEVNSYNVENVNTEYLFLLLNKMRRAILPLPKEGKQYLFLRTRNSTVFILFMISKGQMLLLETEKDRPVDWYLETVEDIKDQL